MVKRELTTSREKAKALIKEGNVSVDGNIETKAGTMCDEDAVIRIEGEQLPYVSRGGLKLKKAIDSFGITLEADICMDVGASTGGFTDCMLKHGASKVYSVDVGHDQLDKSLRQDDRVVCMEGVNVRYISEEDIDEALDFVSIDVSFISLTKVLLPVKALMKQEAEMVCLIKPQFEAGRENIGKNGVVKNRKIHEDVINVVRNFAIDIGFTVLGLEFSPIKGPEGNIEYLIYLKNSACAENRVLSQQIKNIVEAAHASL